MNLSQPITPVTDAFEARILRDYLVRWVIVEDDQQLLCYAMLCYAVGSICYLSPLYIFFIRLRTQECESLM